LRIRLTNETGRIRFLFVAIAAPIFGKMMTVRRSKPSIGLLALVTLVTASFSIPTGSLAGDTEDAVTPVAPTQL
jgi:hypothetical protein